MIDVRPVRSRRDLSEFIDLPERLYRDDPAWTPALKPELRKLLQKETNPWFEHGDAQLFMAYRGDELVGRISAQVDHLHNRHYEERTGFFGFFECIEDAEVAKALFDRASEWLRDRGMSKIRGPLSFGINGIAGCLIDGFEYPPYLDMGHNPPFYPALIEGYGFEKAKDLYAWRYDVSEDPPDMSLNMAEQMEAIPGLKVRDVDMQHFDRDLGIIMEIFNDAWSKNWGYVPLTDAEIRKLADEMKLVIEPRLAFIAEYEGDPVAISVTIPNINQLLLRSRGSSTPMAYARLLWDLKIKKNIDTARLVILGIKKSARGGPLSGLSVLLYVKTHVIGKSLGYRMAELGWTLEDNAKINMGIEIMGGKRYKTYRVYDRDLG